MIIKLPTELEKKVYETFDDLVHKAELDFVMDFSIHLELYTKKLGTAAGLCTSTPDFAVVYLNTALLLKNPEKFFQETIAHEIAHAVDHIVHGYSSSHGYNWQSIMKNTFGIEPSRCHALEVKNTRKGGAYTYKCNTCNIERDLSIIRHNRMVRRPGAYRCGCSRTSKLELIASHTAADQRRELEELAAAHGTHTIKKCASKNGVAFYSHGSKNLATFKGHTYEIEVVSHSEILFVSEDGTHNGKAKNIDNIATLIFFRRHR